MRFNFLFSFETFDNFPAEKIVIDIRSVKSGIVIHYELSNLVLIVR